MVLLSQILSVLVSLRPRPPLLLREFNNSHLSANIRWRSNTESTEASEFPLMVCENAQCSLCTELTQQIPRFVLKIQINIFFLKEANHSAWKHELFPKYSLAHFNSVQSTWSKPECFVWVPDVMIYFICYTTTDWSLCFEVCLPPSLYILIQDAYQVSITLG